MIRLYRASDLPPDVPGMIVTDGQDAAVVVNAALADKNGPAWTRALANSLLAAMDGPPPLRAVVGV